MHKGDDKKILSAVQNANKEGHFLKDQLEIVSRLIESGDHHETTVDGQSVFIPPKQGKYRSTYEYINKLSKLQVGHDEYWKRQAFERAGVDFSNITSKAALEIERVKSVRNDREMEHINDW